MAKDVQMTATNAKTKCKQAKQSRIGRQQQRIY